jgi:hypothetical protein
MKIKLLQEEKDITMAVQMLCKKSKISLRKVCEDNELTYSETYQRLHSDLIDYKWLESLISKINKKAKVKFKHHLTIMLDEQIIINQKSK